MAVITRTKKSLDEICDSFYVPGKPLSEYTDQQIEYFLMHNAEARDIEIVLLGLNEGKRYKPILQYGMNEKGEIIPIEDTIDDHLKSIEIERIALDLEITRRIKARKLEAIPAREKESS